MAVWSTVPISVAIVAGRIDADHYRPEYLSAIATLLNGKGHQLGRDFTVSDGNHSTITPYFSDKDDNNTVPYYRGQDLNGFYLDSARPKRIPISVYQKPRMHRSHFKPHDVLVCIVGANTGTISIVPPSMGQSTGSCKIGIVRRRPGSSYSPEVLAAFLIGRYGQLQISQHKRGTAQSGLILIDIPRLLVPQLGEAEAAEVTQTIEGAIQKNRCALDSFQAAAAAIDDELSPTQGDCSWLAGYTASLSETVGGARIDGEYFQPKYRALRHAIKSYKHGFELLLQAADAIKPNVDPSQAPASDFNYVELSQINSALGMIEGHTQSSGAGLPSRARRQVSAGDVIASAVVGSVDKVALISPAEDGYIASTGFFHFRPKTVSPEYLLMLVRSRCVSMQFQQQATGGILSAVPDGRLKYVIVPRFPQKLQDKVTDLVAQAHQAKRESDALLEKAKARVEQLIEEAIER